VSICAISAVKIGVVALNTDASPLSICFSPRMIRVNGMRLFVAPSTNSAPQMRCERGIDRPVNATIGKSASAATPTRPSTIVNGGKPASSRLVEKERAAPHDREDQQQPPLGRTHLLFTTHDAHDNIADAGKHSERCSRVPAMSP
jgi:hypothetical protein